MDDPKLYTNLLGASQICFQIAAVYWLPSVLIHEQRKDGNCATELFNVRYMQINIPINFSTF